MTAAPALRTGRQSGEGVSAYDQPAPHLPGQSSMWVFILGDLVIFAVYLVIFMVERHGHRELFLSAQRHLDQGLGAVNTLVLLTSSWLIASGLLAARRGAHERAARLTLGAGALGLVFLAIKAVEWTTEIRQGHTLPSNGLYAFYYVLTGVHALHVLIGLVVLGVMHRELRTPSLRRVSVVETGAIYWHMVDLLWILIFALVYVMR